MTSWLGFGKPSQKEQMRQNDRIMRQTQRGLEKDRRELDMQEKQVEAEIKKLARLGNREACVILARQLVNIRKQKNRSCGMSAKVSGINTQTKAMMSNVKIADAMKTTNKVHFLGIHFLFTSFASKVVGDMNKNMNPMQVAKTMKEFEKASTKIDMTEELISDSLDDILNESGDEEEQDAVVNQILDEIGIEMSGQLAKAPNAHKDGLKLGVGSKASTSKTLTDSDLNRMLQNLKE
uniref:Charged multivesicular body protein 2b n=1 Tax=Romanomermis culicivorax TaxID=13658 RepID=A0A915J7Z8_ROMCU